MRSCTPTTDGEPNAREAVQRVGYNPIVKLARLIAVVVALVVPLQGMASVVAAQCMAFGHHDAPPSHDAHDGHEGPGQEAETKSPHCGPCAACCASAGLASPAPGLAIAPSTADAPYVLSQFLPPGERPGSLDRPPLAL